MNEYKKGDPVRVKADGGMWYFFDDINGRARLSGINNPFQKTNIMPGFNYDEIEPLPLRHPYFGKKVKVWDNECDKVERIMIDAVTSNCICVTAVDEKNYYKGENYRVVAYDNWEPLPEKKIKTPKLDQIIERLEATQKEVDAIKAEIKELRNE